MDPLEQELAPPRADIPAVFHSSATGTLFTRCVTCECNLLEPDTHYVIEKAVRRYPGFAAQDTVFEYAMCIPCYETMQQAMSRESLQRVQSFFQHRVNLEARREALYSRPALQIDDWLDRCLVTGAPRESLDEYQIFCQCSGENLLYTDLPYLIGGPSVDEVADLLSNRTLGEIDGFMDRYFGLPPELRKKLMDRPLVMI